MLAAGTAVWGRRRGLETARGTDACATLQTSPLPPVGPDGLAPARRGGRAAGTRPSFRAHVTGRPLQARGGEGGEEPGWGRPGRKQRVPSAARGAGGCSAARGPRLPVRACQLQFLLGAPWAAPAAWPGPMAQTPDGISCELRGKRRPFFAHLSGRKQCGPQNQADPEPWGCRASVSLCSFGGLATPRSTPPLPCWLIDEPRPLAWYRPWAGIDLHGRTRVIQQVALPQARSPGSCGPRRQTCC